MDKIAALPETYGLEPSQDESTTTVAKNPVVGWATVTGNMAHPIYATNIECRAVMFPCGTISDRRLQSSFNTMEDWVTAIFDDDGTETETIPVPTTGASPLLKDLELSGRAVAPLKRIGVETLAQVAVQSREDIAAVKGVSDASMDQLDDLLSKAGLTWDWNADGETVSDDDDDDDDDDLEDVL